MMKIKKEKEEESDWAYSEKNQKKIHISEAESGLKDYRCIGCNARMIANIQHKNLHWKSYFRHHASNVTKEKPECVKASRVYREIIAKTIINRLKYVVTPALYKFPPGKEEDLLPMLIQEKETIKASYTKAELTFYENKNGIVKWGKNIDVAIEDRELLIRPDVTFFNKEDKPILLVEFIVTNKITSEKYIKLSRIGINTVQIKIPTKSEAEIEKALQSSRNYKWVYNEKEANTKYIPVSRGNTENLPQINENERIFFEESFKCRQSEINELIRSIKKCLRSKQYSGIEYQLNKQIQQVERNSERERQELGDLEKLHGTEAQARNSGAEDKERERYRDLEDRYFKKGEYLERSINIERGNESIRRQVENAIKGEKHKIRGIRESTEDFRNRELFETEKIEQEIQEAESTIEFDVESTIEENRLLEEEERYLQESVFREFSGCIESEEFEIKNIEQEENRFENDVRKQFDIDVEKSPEKLTRRTRGLLEARRFFSIYSDFKCKEKSYREARELFNKGTWKER
ncbi:hypothetical protein PG913_06280 [Tenacibaculum pacificus]|uniref:hypothetical protein n=1 Tax=Tenacibaculum pacificus TaxID=3018314 RepID=UPI0022F3FCB2|nr:hypothetical protein [Tenacibaculum pacificus]WBX72532.1 hypothetical protein PG913_06280 [Tenacibaculum pacificus]